MRASKAVKSAGICDEVASRLLVPSELRVRLSECHAIAHLGTGQSHDRSVPRSGFVLRDDETGQRERCGKTKRPRHRLIGHRDAPLGFEIADLHAAERSGLS